MEKFYLKSSDNGHGKIVQLHRLVGNQKGQTIKKIAEVSGWRLNVAHQAITESLKRMKSKGPKSPEANGVPIGEEDGIRLHLAFIGISNLMDVSRAAQFINGIYEMSREEAYYWYAKTQNGTAGRGVRSLRVLLAGVV